MPSPERDARSPGPLRPARAVPRSEPARVLGNPGFHCQGPLCGAQEKEPRGLRQPPLGEALGCPGIEGAEVGKRWRCETSLSLVPQDLGCDLRVAGLRIRLGLGLGWGTESMTPWLRDSQDGWRQTLLLRELPFKAWTRPPGTATTPRDLLPAPLSIPETPLLLHQEHAP